MLLKNIDQEIELVLIKQKQQDLDSFVWGYHAYMDKQTPKVGNENVCLKSENENQYGKFAVAIVLEERIAGHVPKNLSKIFHQFMKIPNCTIGCSNWETCKSWSRFWTWNSCAVQIYWCWKSSSMGRKEHKNVFENINKKVNKCVK